MEQNVKSKNKGSKENEEAKNHLSSYNLIILHLTTKVNTFLCNLCVFTN